MSADERLREAVTLHREENRGRDLRHDAARRRAVPGDLAQHPGEGRDRAAARAARRRRDRGRVPCHLAGRLRGGSGDRPQRRGPGRSAALPGPRRPTSMRPGERQGLPIARESTPSSRPPTSTSSTSSRRPRRRQGAGQGGGRARPRALRGRRVLADGRDPGRRRVHGRGLRDRDRGGRRRRQRPRHRRLHDPRRVRGATSTRPLRAGAEPARRAAVGPLPRRPRPRGRELLRRRPGRSAAGRVRGQRDRGAGRQLLAGGDRDAAADPQRRARLRHRRSRRPSSPGRAAWSRGSPATWSSPTRRSSAATRSRTSPGSTRTACSRSARRSRSWTPATSGSTRTRSCSASTRAATRSATRSSSSASRSRATP